MDQCLVIVTKEEVISNNLAQYNLRLGVYRMPIKEGEDKSPFYPSPKECFVRQMAGRETEIIFSRGLELNGQKNIFNYVKKVSDELSGLLDFSSGDNKAMTARFHESKKDNLLDLIENK